MAFGKRKSSSRTGSTGSSGSSGRVSGSVRPTTPLVGSGSVRSGFVGGPNNQGFGSSVSPTNGANVYATTGGWADAFINALNSSGTYSFADILALFEKSGADISNEQQDVYFQALLQYLAQVDQRKYDQNLTNEQRAYDWQKLTDSRIYDSPTNVLARLMGAGISRDAALQMISGAGSGAGSGVGSAGMPVTQSPMSVSGVPSPSGTTALNIANTAISGAQALGNLVSTGMQIPMAIEQTRALRNQNVLTGAQAEAMQATADMYGIMQMLNAEEDDYKSLNSAIQFISTKANESDPVASEFVNNGGIKRLYRSAPFAAQNFTNLYKNNRSSQDYATQFDKEMRRYDAENAINEVQVNLLNQEIANASAEYDKILADTQYINAQKLVADALKLKTNAETTALNYQNQETEALFGATVEGKSYLDWRTAGVMDELVAGAKRAAKANNDELIQKQFDNMLLNVDVVGATLTFEYMAQQSGIQFGIDHPQEAAMWLALQKVGYYDYFEAQIKNATARDVKTPIVGGNGSVGLNIPSNFNPLYNQHGNDFWRSLFNPQQVPVGGSSGSW